MARGPEFTSQAEPKDVRAAKWWQRKSLLVGGIALAVGVIVPFLATAALNVAVIEGVQAGGTKVYTVFRAKK